MSVLVGTGNIIWSGIYVMVSTIGLVIFLGLLDIYYINPYNITYWWYKGLLFIACMTASVLIFGGLVVGLWYLWERKVSGREESEDDEKTVIMQHNEPSVDKDSRKESFSKTIRYGQRPDFKGMSMAFSFFFLKINK